MIFMVTIILIIMLHHQTDFFMITLCYIDNYITSRLQLP